LFMKPVGLSDEVKALLIEGGKAARQR